jgi:autotransporter-associated beta strand protein
MLQATVARSEVAYWKDINSTWNTGANWSTLAMPTTAGVATFTNNSTYAFPPTPTANTIGGIDVTGSANLTFGAAAVVFTLNGINGIGIYAESTAGAVNFSTTRFTLASAQSWRNASANLMTINGTAIVNGGFLLTLDGSGTGGITFGSTSIISGTGGLKVDRSGGGVVTLGAANTYTGTTTINAGTLAMSAGSLATTNIVIMSGAAFDVSALASGFSVGSGKWLTCGSTSGTAVVNATGKTLTLASGALLAFQADGTSGTVGKMVVTNNLTLTSNVVTVNVNGSTLAQGTYRLLECTGTLTGVAGGDAVMTGTPLSNGCFGFIQTTTGTVGYVELVVRKAPVFTGGSYDGFDSRSFLNRDIPKNKTGTLIRFF